MAARARASGSSARESRGSPVAASLSSVVLASSGSSPRSFDVATAESSASNTTAAFMAAALMVGGRQSAGGAAGDGGRRSAVRGPRAVAAGCHGGRAAAVCVSAGRRSVRRRGPAYLVLRVPPTPLAPAGRYPAAPNRAGGWAGGRGRAVGAAPGPRARSRSKERSRPRSRSSSQAGSSRTVSGRSARETASCINSRDPSNYRKWTQTQRHTDIALLWQLNGT